MGTGGGGQKPKTDGINRKESTKQKRRGWIGGTQNKHGWRKVGKSPNSSKKIIENDWSRNLPGKERRKTALVGDAAEKITHRWQERDSTWPKRRRSYACPEQAAVRQQQREGVFSSRKIHEKVAVARFGFI